LKLVLYKRAIIDLICYLSVFQLNLIGFNFLFNILQLIFQIYFLVTILIIFV